MLPYSARSIPYKLRIWHLFPTIEVLVCGLNSYSLYSMQLEFIQDSRKKYRFSKGKWNENGNAEPLQARAIYRHEHSPKDGYHSMKSAVSFRNIKITNSPDGKNCVVLNSLCSYHVQVHILKLEGSQEVPVKTFNFPQTRFITVTAYQNAKITQLKCKHNVFARRKNITRKMQNCPFQTNVKRCHGSMSQRSVHPQQHLVREETMTDFDHFSPNASEKQYNTTQNIYENQYFHFYDSLQSYTNDSGISPLINVVEINSSDLKPTNTAESYIKTEGEEMCDFKVSNCSIYLKQNAPTSPNKEFSDIFKQHSYKSPERSDFSNYSSYNQCLDIKEEKFSTINVCQNARELFCFPAYNESTSLKYNCEIAKNEIYGVPLVFGNMSDTNV